MCGLAGIVMKDRSRLADVRALESMIEALRHRGPDDVGIEVRGNVALANPRLSIIDLEGGRQPMKSADGNVCVTFNGALYNYVELRRELARSGCRFRTKSDTEVLVHLYGQLGLAMFERLNGMFAFALHDARERRLILVRDRFGEKPLYVYEDAERLVFASEIKAILTLPGVRTEPEPVALHEYVTFQYCHGDRTLFRGIRRLPPAEYLVLDDAGRRIVQRPYWRLPVGEHDTVELDLRALLQEAVDIRLRSDVPVGSYLSGGVDSAVVTALARIRRGSALPAFTGHFAEAGYSELPFAELVAAELGIPLHATQPRPEDLAESLPRILYHLDEPAAGPGVFAQLAVAELAAQHVKVVLGGQGGDEAFGGYARYLVACLAGAASSDGLGAGVPELEPYAPLLDRIRAREPLRDPARRYFTLIDRGGDVRSYLAADFLAERDEEALYGRFEQAFGSACADGGSGMPFLTRMMAYDVRVTLQSLLHVEDRMSMAVSLEARQPLLDHRVVELAFRLPANSTYRDGGPKAALIAAARDLVPAPVLDRTDKMGFPVPFVEWAKGPLRGWIRENLLDRRALGRGIWDARGLERLLRDERRYGRALWGLLCLELWFRTFVDDTPP